MRCYSDTCCNWMHNECLDSSWSMEASPNLERIHSWLRIFFCLFGGSVLDAFGWEGIEAEFPRGIDLVERKIYRSWTLCRSILCAATTLILFASPGFLCFCSTRVIFLLIPRRSTTGLPPQFLSLSLSLSLELGFLFVKDYARKSALIYCSRIFFLSVLLGCLFFQTIPGFLFSLPWRFSIYSIPSASRI
jgi:hypothetical protein